ncbi:hypothetical protein ABIB27_000424 [Arthrobacter sp. UYEF21]
MMSWNILTDASDKQEHPGLWTGVFLFVRAILFGLRGHCLRADSGQANGNTSSAYRALTVSRTESPSVSQISW